MGAQSDEEKSYRDKIATVDKQGKRVWIYPKKVDGPYYRARTYVSWVLLVFLFGMPFVKANGEPILLFNIVERKFIIFGLYFAPQDFYLFVLAMLIFIIFIALFTAVFGRLFCGWVCPQTIFMEMVFRKIEYWIEGDANAQKRLNAAPWTSEKILKKVSKQVIFFCIAVLVANIFLAYIIGIDAVLQIISEPISQNWQGFIAMLFFSGAFYFVFSYLREQVCTAICPYGRLQSVLLDKDSLVVHYDHVRGEPRGKIRKQKPEASLVTADGEVGLLNFQLGDCIDCGLCVQVCPTGIDIRNGTQMECVNCTACMDACDAVMVKVGRPKELIRYDSYEGVTTGRKRLFTPRVIAYSIVLVVLLLLEGFLLISRTPVELLLLRTPGMLYQEVDANTISNLYNYQIVNKTNKDLPVEFRLGSEFGQIKLVGQAPVVKAAQVTEGALFIELPKDKLDGHKTSVRVEIYSGEERLDELKTSFIGPM